MVRWIKITHSAMYGINETIQTLEDFLDLKVNYYAKLILVELQTLLMPWGSGSRLTV